MANALRALRVLDLTTTIAGPHCARLLADIGAEVIKVEGPDGDMMRDRPPLRNGSSTTYGQLNAGKQSVVLNLKSADGAAILRRLVQEADILVENYRPGVMRRLGLDYDKLRPDQTRSDLLRNFGLRTDRPIGGVAGLRAGNSRGVRLRPRAPRIPGRSDAT